MIGHVHVGELLGSLPYIGTYIVGVVLIVMVITRDVSPNHKPTRDRLIMAGNVIGLFVSGGLFVWGIVIGIHVLFG